MVNWHSVLHSGGKFIADVGEGVSEAGEMISQGSRMAEKVGTKMVEAGIVIIPTGQEEISAGLIDAGGYATGIGLAGEAFGEMTEAVGGGIKEVGGVIHHYGDTPRENIKSEHEDHYLVAQGSYDDDKNLDGFTYDKELSNRKVNVWTKDGTKEVYVGYQGTRPTPNKDGLEDLTADYHILTGTEANSKMFKDVDKQTAKIFEKYGDTHKIHSGSHSLGGKLAQQMNCKYAFTSVVTFNMGSSPLGGGCSSGSAQAEVTNYTTGVDPISISTLIPQRREKTYIIKRKKGDPKYDVHTLDRFKPQRK